MSGGKQNEDFSPQGPGSVLRGPGLLRVDETECKGCGLCVEACPPGAIGMSERLNHYGYRTATYAGSGCTACGICFMVCPEPGAITVLRRKKTAVAQELIAEEALACAGN